ncbi:hypothetical protein C2G38_2195898 [Gigaspora rosea]|uniref:Uncharacterized protein n=1 Tax=Gigaspora rosea TaxID=44941 RepID=A0A397UZH3_9GLOM|nr:hypothetical protein C2G38_2195898 [Gigaspora rosea]
MKKTFKKNSNCYSRTLANTDKRQQVAQTQAVIISSEESIERAAKEARLQIDDKQAPQSSESENDENNKEGNISSCELASMGVEDCLRLLNKVSADNKNYTDDDKNSGGEVYIDNVVDGNRKKKNSKIPLQEKQKKEINDNFNFMVKNKIWKLSFGRYVEEELYELGKKLGYDHTIHSFILDVKDEVVLNHFTKEEVEEIDQIPGPAISELSENV